MPDNSLFTELVGEYVMDGLVDYKNLKDDKRLDEVVGVRAGRVCCVQLTLAMNEFHRGREVPESATELRELIQKPRENNADEFVRAEAGLPVVDEKGSESRQRANLIRVEIEVE